jgi:hypothetical protein
VGEDSVHATRPRPLERQDHRAECASCQRKCEKCGLDEHHLQSLIPVIQDFLTKALHLELHPRKVIIRKLIQGIDFVGYVLFPYHRLVRTRTKQRMKKRLREAYSDYLSGKSDTKQVDQRLQSYLEILSHANQHALTQAVKNAYWVRAE